MKKSSDPIQLQMTNQVLLPQTNKLAVLAIGLAFAVTPTLSGAASLESTIIGNTCLVPVFHTEIIFPPEGGKVVQIGNQMYFVQDYKAGCENAGANGVLIKGSPTTSGATTTPITTNPTCTTTQLN